MSDEPAPPWQPRPGAPAASSEPVDGGWASLPGDGDRPPGGPRTPPRAAVAAGVGIVALLLVGLVLVVVELTRSPTPPTAASSAGAPSVAGVEETRRLFAGIPQDGALLGRPDAPVTLYSFVDLQCPYCRDHALQQEPAAIQRLVRSGRVAIRTVPLTGLGPDSRRGAIVAWRAAGQGRMAQFVHLWFLNQGYEGTGYATDGYLRALAGAAGLRPADAQPVAPPQIMRRIALDAGVSRQVGITGTPGFALARRGGTARLWEPPRGVRFVDALTDEVRRLGG